MWRRRGRAARKRGGHKGKQRGTNALQNEATGQRCGLNVSRNDGHCSRLRLKSVEIGIEVGEERDVTWDLGNWGKPGQDISWAIMLWNRQRLATWDRCDGASSAKREMTKRTQKVKVERRNALGKRTGLSPRRPAPHRAHQRVKRAAPVPCGMAHGNWSGDDHDLVQERRGQPA